MWVRWGIVLIALALAGAAVAADRWNGETPEIGAEPPDSAVEEREKSTEGPPDSAVEEREELTAEPPDSAMEERTETAEEATPAGSLLEALEAELNARQVAEEGVPAAVQAFASGYDAQGEPATVVRAGLDGDDRSREWTVLLFEEIRRPGENAVERRTAYGSVVALVDGRYAVSGFEFPEDRYGRAKLEAVEELTGDGRADIVWASFIVGAHTSTAVYTLSSWVDDEWRILPGEAEMPNVSQAEVRDGKLLLTGGLIGSAGAGPWQREYTDAFVAAAGGEGLQLTDRTYLASPTSYHRLIDALWAEALGQTERARKLLDEAIELDDESYAGYLFETRGGIFEGGADPALEEGFEAAIERFARLRLALLTEMEEAGSNREAACAAAKDAAQYEPGWLPLLNLPFGYANPTWDEQSICSPIGS